MISTLYYKCIQTQRTKKVKNIFMIKWINQIFFDFILWENYSGKSSFMVFVFIIRESLEWYLTKVNFNLQGLKEILIFK